jgi:hypothetical protein
MQLFATLVKAPLSTAWLSCKLANMEPPLPPGYPYTSSRVRRDRAPLLQTLQ